MNFKFDEKINNFLKIIAKSAQTQNVRVFFVGGIVRDNILNISNDDIDIIVEGNAITMPRSTAGFTGAATSQILYPKNPVIEEVGGIGKQWYSDGGNYAV